MPDALPTDIKDVLKAAYDFQISELNYRRTHRWNIFTWTASILIGNTSILFVINKITPNLQQSSTDNSSITPITWVLILAIIVLTINSCFWLFHHSSEAEKVKKKKQELINKELSYFFPEQKGAQEAKKELKELIDLFNEEGKEEERFTWNTKLSYIKIMPFSTVVALVALAILAAVTVYLASQSPSVMSHTNSQRLCTK